MQALSTWEKHYEPLLGQIRPGCEPLVLHHGEPVRDAVVLLHGLSDSPHFMRALAGHLYRRGWNVLLPLLPGHGLKDPEAAMVRTRYSDWQSEVDFAVACAAGMGERLSIGGLSTGGALSVWKALSDPAAISGVVLLFSAALDIGDTREAFGRVAPLVRLAGRLQPDRYIGDNPYRYGFMPYEAAAQLAQLIRTLEDRYLGKKKYADLNQPVFAAHSEGDDTAGIKEIELLVANHCRTNDCARFYRLQSEFAVAHASVVLAEPIVAATGEELEKANPMFEHMVKHLSRFLDEQLSG